MSETLHRAYIYQRLRTRGVEPLYLDRAVEHLSYWSERLFDEPFHPDTKALNAQIRAALLNEGFSKGGTHAVEVRLYSCGDILVTPLESLYLESFPLRAIRPSATPQHLTGELLLAPTSAKEAMLAICHTAKLLPSQDIPMWIDHNNEITAIDGAPVIAVMENEIILSHLGDSVEFELAEQALANTTHPMRRGFISCNELPLVKELLYIDHRGITALNDIEGRQLSNIVAERIAKEVQKLDNLLSDAQ